jgi:hypothetical protein
MAFASFPIEIWDAITWHLNVVAIARLYLTGSFVLSAKLLKGGVYHLNASISVHPKNFQALLNFISNFPISSLHIEAPCPANLSIGSFSLISQLSSSLRELTLSNIGAETWWVQNQQILPSPDPVHCMPPNIRSSTLLVPYGPGYHDSPNVNDTIIARFWQFNIGAHFPALESLSLLSPVSYHTLEFAYTMKSPFFNVQSIGDEAIESLPRHLTFLNIHSGHNLSYQCISVLPPTLTIFKTRSAFKEVMLDLNLFPPNLHCLDIPNAIVFFDFSAKYSLLGCLKKLNCGFFCSNSDLVANGDESLLPRNITALGLDFRHQSQCPSLDFLPEKLTRLHINFYNGDRELICSRLPKQLKECRFAHSSAFKDDCIFKLLPDGLETLSLHSLEHLPSKSIRKLPTTLKKLKISGVMLAMENSGFFRHLPRQLLIFEFDNVTTAINISKKDIIKLPRTLQSLKLGGLINEACISVLPPTLSHLQVRGLEISDVTVLSRLPETLSKLYIKFPSSKFEWTSERFLHLPRSITLLICGHTSYSIHNNVCQTQKTAGSKDDHLNFFFPI